MIEMVVVLAVIAILAAILTPIVTSYVERARVNTATNDVKKIAAAIIQFNTDTKVWPIYSTQPFAGVSDTTYDVAASAGTIARSWLSWCRGMCRRPRSWRAAPTST